MSVYGRCVELIDLVLCKTALEDLIGGLVLTNLFRLRLACDVLLQKFSSHRCGYCLTICNACMESVWFSRKKMLRMCTTSYMLTAKHSSFFSLRYFKFCVCKAAKPHQHTVSNLPQVSCILSNSYYFANKLTC